MSLSEGSTTPGRHTGEVSAAGSGAAQSWARVMRGFDFPALCRDKSGGPSGLVGS